jgi:hypothetical protein
MIRRVEARRSENGRYRVMPGRDDGWDVVVERAPGVVSSTYCSDWHRVERLCAALDLQMREPRSGTARNDLDLRGPL